MTIEYIVEMMMLTGMGRSSICTASLVDLADRSRGRYCATNKQVNA
jgi:hypothetical protein